MTSVLTLALLIVGATAAQAEPPHERYQITESLLSAQIYHRLETAFDAHVSHHVPKHVVARQEIDNPLDGIIRRWSLGDPHSKPIEEGPLIGRSVSITPLADDERLLDFWDTRYPGSAHVGIPFRTDGRSASGLYTTTNVSDRIGYHLVTIKALMSYPTHKRSADAESPQDQNADRQP